MVWQEGICLLTTIEATTHSGTKTVFLATSSTACTCRTSEETGLRDIISTHWNFLHDVTVLGEVMTYQGIEATGAPGSGCSRGRSTRGAARPSSTTKKTGLSNHHQYVA